MSSRPAAVVLAFALVACSASRAGGALPLDDPLLAHASAAPSLLLDDEFGGSNLDRKLWFTCYNDVERGEGCTNNPSLELEWYLPGNVSVGGGNLHLVAKAHEAKKGLPYTSGMIQSGGTASTPATFSFLYGYAEIRAKLPRGTGMWPAFWLLQTDNVWPPEIDIMEWQGVSPRGDITTIHWRDKDGRLAQSGSTHFASSPLYEGYHTYAVDWEPASVTWYLDGKPVKRFTQHEWIPKKPMYVLVNLAIGGWEKNQLRPNADSFPATFAVDYVRVWSARPTAPSG